MTTWSDYSVGEYVTEISIPDFGDGGIQRLHSKPLEGKGEKDMSETEHPDLPAAATSGPDRDYGGDLIWGHPDAPPPVVVMTGPGRAPEKEAEPDGPGA